LISWYSSFFSFFRSLSEEVVCLGHPQRHGTR
jgi:hypothetical protein